jgi:8-oxo-dGTP diphosphatase
MKLNYCIECGAKLHKKTTTVYLCANNHPYWNNPRAAAAIVLLKDHQALFSKRARDPKKNQYDFPGGFLEYGESAETAIKRELKEETGLVAKELILIGWAANIYEENTSVCDAVFLSRDWEGQPLAADDSAALEWKPIDFIFSPEFAWDYTGLVDKIKEFSKG